MTGREGRSPPPPKLTHALLRVLAALALLQPPFLAPAQAPNQIIQGAVPPACAALLPVGALSATQTLSLAISLPLRDQDRLFNPMPDGTYLPDGVQLYLWDTLTGAWGGAFTWGSGAWSPSPGTTNLLWSGQGAAIYNPASNAATIVFVGLVRQGWLNIPLVSGMEAPVSSLIPQAGGLCSPLGYPPTVGDIVNTWNQANNTWQMYTYMATRNHQPVPPYWNPQEPVLSTGQAFFLTPAASKVWSRFSWFTWEFQ